MANRTPRDGVSPAPRPAHSVSTSGTSGQLGFGIVLAVAGAVLVFLRSRGVGPEFLWFLAGVVLAVALGLVLWAVALLLRWQALEVRFPQWPLLLNGVHTVELERHSRRRVADARGHLTATVTCTEEAEYQQGTDTRTAREVVHEVAHAGTWEIRNGVFLGGVQIEIPDSRGAPSMSLGHNKILWKVEVDVEGVDRFADPGPIALVVAPEFASGAPMQGYTAGIQDS